MKATVVMDAQRTSAIAHGDHPIAAPLSDETVRRLLERAIPAGTGRVLDLGCGQGRWLARVLTGRPGLRATGVDVVVGDGFCEREPTGTTLEDGFAADE
jgi:SAM-dependent methyltransferase